MYWTWRAGRGVITDHAARIIGPKGRIVGLDANHAMLREATRSRVRHAVQSVAERQPFPDSQFDLLSMGYALRHVTDLRGAFREYKRVLKPGGTLLLLEVTRPRSFAGYHFVRAYMRFVLPLVGMLRSRHPDFRRVIAYYWETIDKCVPPETILQALRDEGFEEVSRRVEMGICSAYTARRPA